LEVRVSDTVSAERLVALKREIRQTALTRRRELPDREAPSRVIWQRFLDLPEYAKAETVMLYVDAPDEVRTQPFFSEVKAAGKRVLVPFCQAGELVLFALESLEELSQGHFGILEPRPELRSRADRLVEPGDLELVMAPGVAFDRRGGRIGYGKGYYDRLLRRAPRGARAVAVAFECQIFAEVPMLEHDVFMDKVITENGIYNGRGRRFGPVQK